ncbi:D-alanyl-D-alanine carboxypeptidase/D-alanyl-D-alanine-endopeptidase [Streptomyces coryli]|uniref:D-alanyl-D-alanine carboxypeptidase/D-alanyl-D-alanine endopeptidase n=1 Tax=Streptomyces coryli TaxID=1128680 RepID=UPI0019D0CEAF|nr:D-alanyl-D-alanine carboxypeptidase/D-alanyl-D-alanine-endopeptidase [Streptomyces coryli]
MTVRQRQRLTAWWAAQERQERRTLQLTAGSAALGLVIAAGTAALAGPWDNGQRTAERDRAYAQDHTGDGRHGRSGTEVLPEAPQAPGVLTALGPGLGAPAGAADGARSGAPAPTATGLKSALEPLLKDKALGQVRTAAVWDVATGRELFGQGEGKAAVPASTVKLATGAAALAALGPGHRIETEVLGSGSRDVWLAGAGDPVLSKERIGDLAKEAAGELKGAKDPVRVRYDTGAYSGPDLHPSLGRNDNLAPVVPLMINEGRLDGSGHGPAPRAMDPAKDAATAFADALRKAGVKVADGAPKEQGTPKGADRLAVTSSPKVADLVERMLVHSDNDIAEHLARQVALKAGKPASFKGGEDAVAAELKKLKLPLKGARFADGSGIDRADKVSAELLTQLLVLASSPKQPDLRPLLTGLPVAGFNGTLKNRYADSGAEAGTGLVRAKTGTLTGVNSLAGTVVDADGRLLAFAFMTNGTKDRGAAQQALDAMAAAVANCGCR